MKERIYNLDGDGWDGWESGWVRLRDCSCVEWMEEKGVRIGKDVYQTDKVVVGDIIWMDGCKRIWKRISS